MEGVAWGKVLRWKMWGLSEGWGTGLSEGGRTLGWALGVTSWIQRLDEPQEPCDSRASKVPHPACPGQ